MGACVARPSYDAPPSTPSAVWALLCDAPALNKRGLPVYFMTTPSAQEKHTSERALLDAVAHDAGHPTSNGSGASEHAVDATVNAVDAHADADAVDADQAAPAADEHAETASASASLSVRAVASGGPLVGDVHMQTLSVHHVYQLQTGLSYIVPGTRWLLLVRAVDGSLSLCGACVRVRVRVCVRMSLVYVRACIARGFVLARLRAHKCICAFVHASVCVCACAYVRVCTCV
jgi:hypothetical protein